MPIAEVVGPNAKAAVEAMKDGDVVLLENTRYQSRRDKERRSILQGTSFSL